jgi:hypothetical protein
MKHERLHAMAERRVCVLQTPTKGQRMRLRFDVRVGHRADREAADLVSLEQGGETLGGEAWPIATGPRKFRPGSVPVICPFPENDNKCGLSYLCPSGLLLPRHVETLLGASDSMKCLSA